MWHCANGQVLVGIDKTAAQAHNHHHLQPRARPSMVVCCCLWIAVGRRGGSGVRPVPVSVSVPVGHPSRKTGVQAGCDVARR